MENKQPSSSPAGERENIMGTMDINPLLIKLSVPMMVSMLVQALYNVVDSIFVSHVSESALTAVSLAFSLQNVMIAVGVGTGVGVNALLSKSLGEKNQERANQTAENGIFLSLCSYAVFLVIGLTCMKPYFYAQTSDMDIARQGIQYLQLCCVLSLGLFTQTMGEKLLAATGRTHLSMISQLVGAVVNIVLDPIFIFGYCGEALSGTTGAAAATVIGQFCGAGMTLYFNLNKNPDIQISFRGFRPSAKAIGHGGLKEGQVLNKLIETYEKQHKKEITDEQVLEAASGEKVLPVGKSKGGIVVRGIHDVAVRFSKCCNPIPGDEIVGFVTRGRGVTIHRTDCVNVLNLPESERARLIDAEWQAEDNGGSLYTVEISVYANNRTGLLVDISKIFTERKIDLAAMNVRTSKQGTASIDVTFDVHNNEELNSIIEKVRQVESVINIQRSRG